MRCVNKLKFEKLEVHTDHRTARDLPAYPAFLPLEGQERPLVKLGSKVCCLKEAEAEFEVSLDRIHIFDLTEFASLYQNSLH